MLSDELRCDMNYYAGKLDGLSRIEDVLKELRLEEFEGYIDIFGCSINC